MKNEIWFLRQEIPMPLDLDAKQFVESSELAMWRSAAPQERMARILDCRASLPDEDKHFFALKTRAVAISVILFFVLIVGFLLVDHWHL